MPWGFGYVELGPDEVLVTRTIVFQAILQSYRTGEFGDVKGFPPRKGLETAGVSLWVLNDPHPHGRSV